MRVVVDSREHDLIDELREMKFDFDVETLDVADIQLVDDDGRPKISIERKTYADLEASICDGRWREQKFRLQQLDHFFIYLLEGKHKKGRLNPKATRGAIMNAILRDKIHFVHTTSLKDTAILTTELEKRTKAKRKRGETGLAAPTISKRMRMEDAKTIYIRQLMCIPKVSERIATELAEVYPTRDKLRTALTNRELDDFKVENRRIGKLVQTLNVYV